MPASDADRSRHRPWRGEVEKELHMPPPAPILAVDDSAPIREMMVAVLAARGHRVITAADGGQALERLRVAVEPFVILLDVIMPVLDGIAVCQQIAQDEALRRAGHRIILMSSPARFASLDVPPTAGRLVKPFSRQQLIEAVEARGHPV